MRVYFCYFFLFFRIFSGRYCFALCLVFFFNVCGRSIFRTASRISTKFSHKVEGWTGWNPIENGRHRFSHLAAILEKLLFSHNYDSSSSTDCTGVAFSSAQALTIHCIQCIDFICLKIISITHAPGNLILSSSSLAL